jgi:hypothetical protein
MTKGAVQIFDFSYTIDNAAGVGQFVAVVQGAGDGTCKLPTGANAAGFLGFTQATQTRQNQPVSVRRLGISAAIANGAIARGDRLAIATNAGDVMSVETIIAAGLKTPAAEYNLVGTAENTVANAGDIVYVYLRPETVPLAAS